MDNRWTNVTELLNPDVFQELEMICNTSTTSLFKEFIQKYNGGRANPMPYIYKSSKYVGYTFSRVLSFNKEDEDNVFSVIESMGNIDFIPFAASKESNKLFVIQKNAVYVLDTLTGEKDRISGNFGSFMMLLR